MTDEPPVSRLGSLARVLLVALGGGIIGLAITFLVRPMPGPPGPHGVAAPTPHLLLLSGAIAGIDLALLVALVAVYLRTYLDTRARFAAGLVVFLVALLLQTFVTAPFIVGAFGFGVGGLWPFLFASSLFGAVALAVFLFLSLE